MDRYRVDCVSPREDLAHVLNQIAREGWRLISVMRRAQVDGGGWDVVSECYAPDPKNEQQQERVPKPSPLGVWHTVDPETGRCVPPPD